MRCWSSRTAAHTGTSEYTTQKTVAAGRLVRPFDISLPADYAYYMVCAEASADLPKIKAFRDWMLDEAQAVDEGA